MTRTWWQSNRVALAALIVLIPAGAVTFAGSEIAWLVEGDDEPRVIPIGETAVIGGYTVGPVTAERFPVGEDGPPGAVIVAVTAPTVPGAGAIAEQQAIDEAKADGGTSVMVPAFYCSFGDVNSVGGGGPWKLDNRMSDVPWPSWEFDGSCIADESAIGVSRVAYFVPDSVTDDLLVTVTSGDETIAFQLAY